MVAASSVACGAVLRCTCDFVVVLIDVDHFTCNVSDDLRPAFDLLPVAMAPDQLTVTPFYHRSLHRPT